MSGHRLPAGRCTRCRKRVPGLFLSCPGCRGDVMASTEARDGAIIELADLAHVARSGGLI